jgi:hypothetical protein
VEQANPELSLLISTTLNSKTVTGKSGGDFQLSDESTKQWPSDWEQLDGLVK